MSDEDTTAPATEEQRVYSEAYNQVAANHQMQPVSKDAKERELRCSCGDTGDAVDMAGHFGEEADRAGQAAVAALQQ